MKSNWFETLLGVLICLSPSSLTWAVTPFQVNTFQAGTVEGWSGGANPTWIASGGPLGSDDAFLQITSSGDTGPGAKPATLNSTPTWAGNYSNPDLLAITVDMQNSVTSAQALNMRLVLFSGSDRWTSTVSEVVPKDGMWHRYRFYLAEDALTRVLGSLTYDQMIQDVFQIMLRHDSEPPSSGGQEAAAVLGIDNVRLVPQINCSTFDGLVAAIVAGTHDPAWDINHDNAVTVADLDELRALGGLVNLASRNPYLPGDANLDGVVDGADFIEWNANKFSMNASWCAGDFNADGVVDGSDFITWNANKFSAADNVAVPEPTVVGSVLLAMLLCWRSMAGTEPTVR